MALYEIKRNAENRVRIDESLAKTVVFGPLTKTSTGKVQKNLLRERAREL